MTEYYEDTDIDEYNISASQVKTHAQCPLQYKMRYIDGMEASKKDSDYVKLGSRVHETLEDLLDREDPPPLHDREILRRIIKEAYKERTDYWIPEGLYEDGLTCCEKAADYLCKRQPDIRGVEQRVEFDITRPDMETGVTSIMDVITDGEIWDWKTGRIRDDTPHEEKIQGSLYMAAYYHLHGEKPDAIRFIYVKEGKVRTLEPTDENWDYMLSRAKSLLHAKKTGEFPANPGDHCYWCAYEFWCPASPVGAGDVPWEEY